MQSKVYYIITKRSAYDQTLEHSLTEAIWNQYYLFSCRSWMEKHRSLEKSWFIMKNSLSTPKIKQFSISITKFKFGAWKGNRDFIEANTKTFIMCLCLLQCLAPQRLLSQGPPFLTCKEMPSFKMKITFNSLKLIIIMVP